MAAKTQLSDLQLAVVRRLWARGEATVAEVHGDLLAPRGLAPATVATVMTRLEKDGVLARRREGRQYLYRALVSEDELKRGQVRSLVERLFGGRAEGLLAHLVRAGDVDEGDLERISTLLARGAD